MYPGGAASWVGAFRGKGANALDLLESGREELVCDGQVGSAWRGAAQAYKRSLGWGILPGLEDRSGGRREVECGRSQEGDGEMHCIFRCVSKR